MAEELLMSVDDAIEYVRNNVKVGDTLEISYNRILRSDNADDVFGSGFYPGKEVLLIGAQGSPGSDNTPGKRTFLRCKNNRVDFNDIQYAPDHRRGRYLYLGRISKRIHIHTVFHEICSDLYRVQNIRHGLF